MATESELLALDAYWRAANYLTVGQIYLQANPLLREPLRPEHIKPRLLGHWGTSPGLSFIYAHLNRVIRRDDLDVLFLAGPGHGGPAVVANTYLEGTYSEIYPDGHARRCAGSRGCSGSSRRPAASRATSGRRRRARSTKAASSATCSRTRSAPCSTTRISSRSPSSATARPRPGRSKARGRASASSNPARDGAVLPILHLNGYKISGPTVLGRASDDDDRARCSRPRLRRRISSRATIRCACIEAFAATLDALLDTIRAIQSDARVRRGVRGRRAGRRSCSARRRAGPGPKIVDGVPIEGTFRAHQVPLAERPRRIRSSSRCSSAG